VLAGLAAGTVVIPQAMAYSTIAETPVEIGLYTCMAPMVVYALLGGARALSVSTTSTIAVLVAATIAGLPEDQTSSTSDTLSAAFTLTFLVGVCLLGLRLLRLGGLIEMISPATMTGIRLGVGLTVAATQLAALLGVPASDSDGFFGKVADAFRDLPDADTVTTTVSVVVIVLLLVQRRVAPTLPGPLIVVAASILLVATTNIEDTSDGHGLALIDHVPTGLPTPSLPVLSDVPALLPGAVAIAVMAFLETVLVARTNRRRGEPPIDVDQELVAVGTASLAGGLAQSLPPAGGFSQSAVNLRSGARSQLAQLVTAVLAVLVALFQAPLLDDLPKAVLAAMVVVAIVGLLSPADLWLYGRIDRAELWVALVVAAIGLVGGMLLGVAVGVALTLALVVRSVNRPRVRAAADPSPATGTLVLHLTGALYAGNARPTVDAALELASASDPAPERVVLVGSAVHDVTVPMLEALRDLRDELGETDTTLVLAAFPPETLTICRRMPWFADYEARGLVTPHFDEPNPSLAHAEPTDDDQEDPS
jgi:MFS superfamily sulfate permease-like transporter